MRIKGNYILREIAGEILVVPVGGTSLETNGLIVLNPAGRLIWEQLEREAAFDVIVDAVLERFEVSKEEASADIRAFLDVLHQNGLLENDLK